MAKTLVIYYSRRGENYVDGGIRRLEKGNVETLAEYIRDAVGAELFEVETVREYAADYTKCTEEAQAEQRANARPELKRYLEDISGYDKIVVAGPCWWGTYPMAVFTQLDKLDFKGKTVFPVMSHEGSGQAGSVKALKQHCKGATVGEGLAVRGGSTAAARDTVSAWAKKVLA